MRHLRTHTTIAATAAFAVIATGALAAESSNDELWRMDELEADPVPVEDTMWSSHPTGDTTDGGDASASDHSEASRASKASRASQASAASSD